MLNWEENTSKMFKNLLVDVSHVVAKGKKEDVLNAVEGWSFDYNTEGKVEITIDENFMDRTEIDVRDDVTRIGNSNVSNEYLLGILEDISNTKIIAKSKGRPMKKWWGKKIAIDYLASDTEDVPVIIKSDKEWYVVAPVVIND